LESKEEVHKIKQEGVAVADGLLADTSMLKEGVKTDLVGEFAGYEPLLVAMARADLVESARADQIEISAAWKQASEIGKKAKITAAQPGPALRYLIVLIKAEEFDESEKLVNQMLKRDPNNPELQRRKLRVLLGQKKFVEASRLGEKVLKNSYGRNEFWVAEVLAKSYLGAKENAKAKSLLDRYLSRNESEWSNIEGTRKTLEALRAQAEGPIEKK
jgi:predicted Zn-dependent protease